MKIRCSIGVLAVALLATPFVSAQETGTLRLQFKYGGDKAPKPEPINVDKDKEYCGKHNLVDESLVVNPESMGIQNVIVWLSPSRRSNLPEMEPRNETVVLANDECRFDPHVVVLQTGDTLKVTNPDPIGHNAKMDFFSNDSVNPMIPAKQEVEVVLEKAEPIPGSVTCSIHPWMKGYVLVKEHPFFAVSDENGIVEIKGLPAGEELRFQAWQEKAGYVSDVVIDGDKESWRAGRFEKEIEPGTNDMGTITIPADVFSD